MTTNNPNPNLKTEDQPEPSKESSKPESQPDHSGGNSTTTQPQGPPERLLPDTPKTKH